MFMTTPRELAPDEDQGVLFACVNGPQYATLDYTEQSTSKIDEMYQAHARRPTTRFTINGFRMAQQASRWIVKPWGERARNQKPIQQDLQACSPDAGVQAFDSRPPPCRLDRRPAGPVRHRSPPGLCRQACEGGGGVQKAAMQSGISCSSRLDLRFDPPQIE